MALEKITLGTLTADGSGAWVKVTSAMHNHAGAIHIRATGTLGGGSLKIEGSQDQTNAYSTGAGGLLYEAGSAEVRLLAGEYVRVTVTGATSPNVQAFVLIPNSA